MKIRHLERQLQPNNIIYVLLVLGFVIGMVLAFAIKDPESEGKLLWLDNILLYLKYSEIQYGDMLFYVLKKRLSLVFFIAILCISGKGKYFLAGGVVLAGGFAGFFITEFIIAKGILGSILFIVSIFPHYLFYGYAYYRLLLFLLRYKGMRLKINQSGQKTSKTFELKEGKYIQKVAPFAVVIIGMLLDCYVNPFFLKIFLKIFM